VIELLDRIAESVADGRAVRIADIGTGSGNLAICAARQLPHCRVVAVDVSPEALAVARRNAVEHGVADRIEFVQCDLFAAVRETATFDFVISNPPYVGEAEVDQLAPETRDHEPRLALIAGPTGTEVIARLIPQAAQRLAPGGWLIFEISPMIESATRQLIADSGSFHEPRVIKDLAQLPRVLSCQRTG
jgi:release factor glutamine methyltransferase